MSDKHLKRELGVFGAVMMGLGSIVGTGVFVSIGIAAGITGPSVVLAVMIGALVATFNGLSSAQLAANHAVSGGTYEYGYKYLTPLLGFSAGWMFLIAKSASAATAALGFAGYVLALTGSTQNIWLIPLALTAIIVLSVVVLGGISRSNIMNIVIVSLALASLLIFIVTGMPTALQNASLNLNHFFTPPDGNGGVAALLHASALMFVAYTGYGRIATLGEEVKTPRVTIPRAIIMTLISTMVLYGLVALVSVSAAGAATLSNPLNQAAPLEVAARLFAIPGVPMIVAVGAIIAMLGVLLNLILGLSRVLLAMGRRRDMPAVFARLNADSTTPTAAVIMVSVIIAVLALTGNVKTTWSFSAFTVLIYYAITNLAALFIPKKGRLFPAWVSVMGLLSCVLLAFFIEPRIWLIGLALLGSGVLWHVFMKPLFGSASP